MADNNLYPVVDIPEYEEENEEYDTEYKPSVAWDLEKGDFVCKSPFCMLKSEGLEAYKICKGSIPDSIKDLLQGS